MSEATFRSPFAALVWKEWRESWWLLTLTVIGPMAWIIIASSPQKWSERVGFADILGGLVVCGLALSLAAGLFASERMRGTDAFQNERPIGRAEVWDAKLLLPLLAVLSGAILLAIAWWLWPLRQETGEPLDILLPFFMVIAWFLFFASAVLCSVLLDRPLTAGAAGGVLGISVVVGQFALFDHFIDLEGTVSYWHWSLFLFLLFVEAFGLLQLSRVVYVERTRD